MMEHFMERDELEEALRSVYDLERLAGRISFGNVNARDLLQLKQSLQQIPQIKNVLSLIDTKEVAKLNESLHYPTQLVDLLERSLKEDAPMTIKEGNIIKSLKVVFNKVFGYYIEVTHANKHLLPEGRYERKQTLRNAERYITPELKEKEAIILEAEEKSVELEYDLFVEVRDTLKEDIIIIQKLASVISEIDVLQSFAEVSEANNYVKPTFVENTVTIKNGRHPVIEKVIDDGSFVPNDVYLNDDDFILLITGPNMSGKSTYM